MWPPHRPVANPWASRSSESNQDTGSRPAGLTLQDDVFDEDISHFLSLEPRAVELLGRDLLVNVDRSQRDPMVVRPAFQNSESHPTTTSAAAAGHRNDNHPVTPADGNRFQQAFVSHLPTSAANSGSRGAVKDMIMGTTNSSALLKANLAPAHPGGIHLGLPANTIIVQRSPYPFPPIVSRSVNNLSMNDSTMTIGDVSSDIYRSQPPVPPTQSIPSGTHVAPSQFNTTTDIVWHKDDTSGDSSFSSPVASLASLRLSDSSAYETPGSTINQASLAPPGLSGNSVHEASGHNAVKKQAPTPPGFAESICTTSNIGLAIPNLTTERIAEAIPNKTTAAIQNQTTASNSLSAPSLTTSSSSLTTTIPTTLVSANNQGDLSLADNISASIPENRTTSLCIKNLPRDVTVTQILNKIRKTGKVFFLHLRTKPDNQFRRWMRDGKTHKVFHPSAKICFFSREAAERFYAATSRGFLVNGWFATVVWNKGLIPEHVGGEWDQVSRVVVVRGPRGTVGLRGVMEVINQEIQVYANLVRAFQRDLYLTREVEIEVHFGSFVAQAQSAHTVLSMAFRGMGKVTVSYGTDPCA